MKTLKKIFYTFVALLALTSAQTTYWAEAESNIWWFLKWLLGIGSEWTVSDNYNNPVPSSAKTALVTTSVDGVLKWVVDTLFWILVVVAIWAILYLWIRLVLARWNQEELTKVTKNFIYIVLGLALISWAYAIITFVTKISI